MKYNNQSVAYKRDMMNIKNSDVDFKLIKSRPIRVLGISPCQAVMLLIALIFMVSCLIYSKVVLDKIGLDIVTYEKQYEDLLSEKIRLEMNMESNISLKNLEELARKNGLHPIQDYQIEYIDFQTEDNIKVVSKRNHTYKLVKKVFNRILAYLR